MAGVLLWGLYHSGFLSKKKQILFKYCSIHVSVSWKCLTASSCCGYAFSAFMSIVIPERHFNYYNEIEENLAKRIDKMIWKYHRRVRLAACL